MKTKNLFHSILLSFVSMLTIVSCTKDADSNSDCINNEATESLELSLDSLNRSIMSKLKSCHSSISCECVTRCNSTCSSSCKCGCKNKVEEEEKDTTNVVLQDAWGAFVGAAAGATIGSGAGTVTLPFLGTVAVGTVLSVGGAIVGGVAHSWNAWHNGYTVPSFDVIVGTLNSELENNSNLLYNNNPLFLQNLSSNTCQYFQFAGLHNYVIENINDTTNVQYKYDSVIPNYIVDSLANKYDEYRPDQCIEAGAQPVPIPGDMRLKLVLSQYATLFMSGATSLDNVNTIVSNYLSYIENSNNFTDEEKLILILSISVSWHSYQYWTNYE